MLVAGFWDVDIHFEDRLVAGSPFPVNVFDAGQGVITKDKDAAFIHDPFVFLGKTRSQIVFLEIS